MVWLCLNFVHSAAAEGWYGWTAFIYVSSVAGLFLRAWWMMRLIGLQFGFINQPSVLGDFKVSRTLPAILLWMLLVEFKFLLLAEPFLFWKQPSPCSKFKLFLPFKKPRLQFKLSNPDCDFINFDSDISNVVLSASKMEYIMARKAHSHQV